MADGETLISCWAEDTKTKEELIRVSGEWLTAGSCQLCQKTFENNSCFRIKFSESPAEEARITLFASLLFPSNPSVLVEFAQSLSCLQETSLLCGMHAHKQTGICFLRNPFIYPCFHSG